MHRKQEITTVWKQTYFSCPRASQLNPSEYFSLSVLGWRGQTAWIMLHLSIKNEIITIFFNRILCIFQTFVRIIFPSRQDIITAGESWEKTLLFRLQSQSVSLGVKLSSAPLSQLPPGSPQFLLHGPSLLPAACIYTLHFSHEVTSPPEGCSPVNTQLRGVAKRLTSEMPGSGRSCQHTHRTGTK